MSHVADAILTILTAIGMLLLVIVVGVIVLAWLLLDPDFGPPQEVRGNRSAVPTCSWVVEGSEDWFYVVEQGACGRFERRTVAFDIDSRVQDFDVRDGRLLALIHDWHPDPRGYAGGIYEIDPATGHATQLAGGASFERPQVWWFAVVPTHRGDQYFVHSMRHSVLIDPSTQSSADISYPNDAEWARLAVVAGRWLFADTGDGLFRRDLLDPDGPWTAVPLEFEMLGVVNLDNALVVEQSGGWYRHAVSEAGEVSPQGRFLRDLESNGMSVYPEDEVGGQVIFLAHPSAYFANRTFVMGDGWSLKLGRVTASEIAPLP